MTQPRPAAVVVLAAGLGKRMRSSLPKVLHEVAGRPLLGHVLTAADGLGAERTVVVVGHGREHVEKMLAQRLRRLESDPAAYPETHPETHPDTHPEARPEAQLQPVAGARLEGRAASFGDPSSQSPNGFHPPRPSVATVATVVQERPGGTGDAVRVAMAALVDLSDSDVVVVMPGDTPLLTPATLSALLAEHGARAASATMLTAAVSDATGYGRVVRAADGGVRAVVEHRDADEATRALNEINAGVYVFEVGPLRESLARLTTTNSQGEEYVTEVIELQVAAGRAVAAHRCADPDEVAGVNDRIQLAAAGRILRDRIVTAAMESGTTVVDPASTWIDAEVTLEPDTTIWPNTYLRGRTRLGRGSVVGPDCTLADTIVGAGAVVRRTTAEDSEIGPDAVVGPYSNLRAGTRLGAGGKLGAFVETKAAEFGEGAKVPHLSYVGDAVVGARSNIGCTAVFVNYDGVDKHRTIVGSDVRIGSDTMLVAPVTIGDGAYTAAGSVVKEDVPPGTLAIREGRQRNIEGWVGRRRPGSPAALAASEARRESGHSNGSTAGVRGREA